MARAQGVWRALRNHPIATCLAVAFLAGILLLVGAVRSARPIPLPTFRFLGDQTPVAVVRGEKKAQHLSRYSRALYSAVADFNNVRATAETELLGCGFITAFADSTARSYEYQLRGSLPHDFVSVKITDRCRVRAGAQPKDPPHEALNPWTIGCEDGWVSVEILHEYAGSRLWDHIAGPVRRLLWRMGLSRPKETTPGLRPAKAAGRA